jgi:ABC-type sulfate/molybdate transport systems ATPase subunit
MTPSLNSELPHLLVRLSGVAKSFQGRMVLSKVDLEIHAGTNLLLTGPSGAGKTTVLRLIAGLDTPEAGTVEIGDRVGSRPGVVDVPPHRRGLALLFQDLGLWPNLSALQNVVLGLSGLKLKRSERLDRAHAALVACELGALANQRPARLSGGEQQRVALARAMATEPRLLLLDEPFVGLDWPAKQALLDRLRRLCADHNTTVLLASHYLADARALAAETVVLENGVIVERGELAALLAQPRSRTLAAWNASGIGDGK